MMIRRNTFVAEEHIEDFNRVRIILTSLRAPFSEKVLKELLKEYNLVSNSLFIGELRKSGIIQTKRKMLVFTDKPVHFNKLQEVYLQYQKKVNEYSKRLRIFRYHRTSQRKWQQVFIRMMHRNWLSLINPDLSMKQPTFPVILP